MVWMVHSGIFAGDGLQIGQQGAKNLFVVLGRELFAFVCNEKR